MDHSVNQSGTSDYYDQRADLIGLAAELFLHFAVVHQHKGSAANRTLEGLVSATCKVSQLKPYWPQFRGYTNRGHEGIERVLHLLDKLFLNLDDEENSGWTNPTWGEAGSAGDLLVRLQGYAASEGFSSPDAADEAVRNKFRDAVKAAARSSPDDRVVSDVFDEFVLQLKSKYQRFSNLEDMLSRSSKGRARRGPEDKSVRKRVSGAYNAEAELPAVDKLRIEMQHGLAQNAAANAAALRAFAAEARQFSSKYSVTPSEDCPTDITTEMIEKATTMGTTWCGDVASVKKSSQLAELLV